MSLCLQSSFNAAILAVRADLFTDKIQATTGIPFTVERNVSDDRTVLLQAIGDLIIAILDTSS